jgi:hypothetical protein
MLSDILPGQMHPLPLSGIFSVGPIFCWRCIPEESEHTSASAVLSRLAMRHVGGLSVWILTSAQLEYRSQGVLPAWRQLQSDIWVYSKEYSERG